MARGYNFGAGPATLPEDLLKTIQIELLEWQNSGMSILEIGHRTPEFKAVLHRAEQTLRQLLGIPSDYHVLFMNCSARALFAMIPMNFIDHTQHAGYLITGAWSAKAYAEASRIKSVYCIASGSATNFISVPEQSEWSIKDSTAYLYYTPNETINGLYCSKPTLTTSIPIIADMTSCLLTESISVSDYALIFAGAQKNIANSGMTIVIIKDAFLNTITNNNLPQAFDFRIQVAQQSLYSTPPTFNCYVADKMFSWIESQGGIAAMHANNLLKSRKVYCAIDQSNLYTPIVTISARSFLNMCFTLPNNSLEDLFVAQSHARNLLMLRGHAKIGGIRVSSYNAMPLMGIDKLVEFMNEFSMENL